MHYSDKCSLTFAFISVWSDKHDWWKGCETQSSLLFKHPCIVLMPRHHSLLLDNPVKWNTWVRQCSTPLTNPPQRRCCWMMVPLKHTHSYTWSFPIRSWQSAGLTAKRPLKCHHHSLWSMLSCLPQSRRASCLISLSASGILDLFYYPCFSFFIHSVLHCAEFHGHYSFLLSHLAVRVHHLFLSVV